MCVTYNTPFERLKIISSFLILILVQFNVDSFDEAGLQPVAEDDPYSTDVHQCSMFYNLPSTFADKLQTLDNKVQQFLFISRFFWEGAWEKLPPDYLDGTTNDPPPEVPYLPFEGEVYKVCWEEYQVLKGKGNIMAAG